MVHSSKRNCYLYVIAQVDLEDGAESPSQIEKDQIPEKK